MRPFGLAPLAAAVAAAFVANEAFGLPTGSEIRAGQGAITSPNAGSVVVRQDSARLAIDWQSFGIAAGESVRFMQPGASSIALNRVLGNSRSEIFGNLSANGQVFLLNANGVLFGRSAQVDVGGLVASTLDLSVADFMAGKTTFSGGNGGAVVNQGRLSAASGRYVALLGPVVRNEGVIEARMGTVALAAGEQVTLNFGGNSLVGLSVDRGVVGALAENRQLIQADGGRVLLSARAADDVVRAVVNNSGVIEANSVSNVNGLVRLEGLGASTVTLEAGSTIQSSRVELSAGENIRVSGSVRGAQSVAIAAPDAVMDLLGGEVVAPDIHINTWSLLGAGSIDASGAMGGSVHIDTRYLSYRGEIRADGRAGDGGSVTINAQRRIMLNDESVIPANGTASGGSIALTGASGFALLSGTIEAKGGDHGGTIAVTAPNVTSLGGRFDASGEAGGGTILLGGDWQGGGSLPHAQSVYVDERSTLNADANSSGNGGKIVAWSDQQTSFGGQTTARGGTQAGDGGAIEISSKNDLALWSAPNAAARAAGGTPGSVLLDPKNIIIADGGEEGITIFRALFAPDQALPASWGAGDAFGRSVALSGDLALIGAPFDSTRGASAGNAYLYNTTTGAWTDLAAAGTPPASWSAGDLFGFSVALTGNTALIGAISDATRGANAGNAYLFNTSTNAWTDFAAAGTPPASWSAGDQFGYSVALSGTTALIGAPLDATRGANSGNAYLYNTGTSAWTDLAAAGAPPASWGVSDQFGHSVALSGTTALIAAPLDATRGANAGNAYLYNTSTSAWTDLATSGTPPASWGAVDQFGNSVALLGNTALIGAPFDATRGVNAGNAYL